MKKMLFAAGLALALTMTGVTMAPAQEKVAETPAGKVRHVPLTVDKAKAALDAMLEIREKYADAGLKAARGGVQGVIEAMKKSPAADRIIADLKKRGFSGIEDWMMHFITAGMAVSYVRGKRMGRDLDAKIAEIAANKTMPSQMKEKLLGMLRAMVPPPANVEVAKKLLADETVVEKIKRLRNGGE